LCFAAVHHHALVVSSLHEALVMLHPMLEQTQSWQAISMVVDYIWFFSRCHRQLLLDQLHMLEPLCLASGVEVRK
jgi:hypothetical protein